MKHGWPSFVILIWKLWTGYSSLDRARGSGGREASPRPSFGERERVGKLLPRGGTAVFDKGQIGGSGPPREAAGVPAGDPRQASSSVRRFEVAGFFFFFEFDGQFSGRLDCKKNK